MIVALLLALAVPAAAESGWVIDSFHAEIAIRPSGDLSVLEAIDVNFGGLQKHGILRIIPTRYRFYDTQIVSTGSPSGR